jgi:hypothetical protein
MHEQKAHTVKEVAKQKQKAKEKALENLGQSKGA